VSAGKRGNPVQEVRTERIVWDEFPEGYPCIMEFRLIYDGPLKAAGGGKGGRRTEEKHAIRKVLHKQLARIWEINPNLKVRTKDHTVLFPGAATWDENQKITSRTMATSHLHQSLCKTLGENFNRCGYKFVPLVNNHLKLSCGLDILFLRRDMPGVPLIHSGGDIDNRLKVLFDALRVPENCSELTGAVKEPNEEPYFFCLLEDDALITDVSITTDTLLTPYLAGTENDVHLVIKVKVRPTDFSFENLDFVT
jgi:hypothetical protein